MDLRSLADGDSLYYELSQLARLASIDRLECLWEPSMLLAALLRERMNLLSMSVEEYIEGKEYTFDTVYAAGQVVYENIAWYRPKPMIGRTEEWISMQTINLRKVDGAYLQAGRKLGHAVLKALGFRTGFTHMEWFLKPDGEAVFGEIGARPPGGTISGPDELQQRLRHLYRLG